MNDPRVLASLEVTEEGDGLRIDAWCAGRVLGLPTRSSVRKALKRERVCVNGHPVESSRRVRTGDRIDLLEDDSPVPLVYPHDLRVPYEDQHLAVVYKPAGLRVNGNQWKTLENALPHNLTVATGAEALHIPRVAHRLDMPTQGLVACAKTSPALVGLGWGFERRTVAKTYRALVLGRLEEQGKCDTPVEGRAAETLYRPLEHTRCLKAKGQWLTTVELRPVTGRGHQLRRHMAELGHPVLGDAAHTPAGVPVFHGKGLFLAALRLQFRHPVTDEPLDVEVDQPEKFGSMRRREARRWLTYHPEPT